MQYLCLIYEAESLMATRSDEQNAEMFADYNQFTQQVKDTNKFVAGEALTPTSTASTVRIRNGETVITDGPFAETKEQLGGFYMLECDSLDDALAQAAKIPAAKYGCVEVRPVMIFDNM